MRQLQFEFDATDAAADADWQLFVAAGLAQGHTGRTLAVRRRKGKRRQRRRAPAAETARAFVPSGPAGPPASLQQGTAIGSSRKT